MGMSYDEFWNNTDFLLVESYIKRHEMIIDQETANNWELVSMIREALFEVATAVHAEKDSQRHKFPSKPMPRTVTGQLEKERNDKIDREIKLKMNEKMSKY